MYILNRLKRTRQQPNDIIKFYIHKCKDFDLNLIHYLIGGKISAWMLFLNVTRTLKHNNVSVMFRE